jgi:hypothetical protein
MHMNYGARTPRVSMLGETVVVNTYRTYTFEYGDAALRQQAERDRQPL